MAVVVNEFEVVPAEPRTRESPPRTDETQSPARPRDPEREVERMLRRRSARALRLMAV
jgi:hypothetical protein